MLCLFQIRAVDKVPPATAWLNEKHKVVYKQTTWHIVVCSHHDDDDDNYDDDDDNDGI